VRVLAAVSFFLTALLLTAGELTILAVGDTHGEMENWTRLAALICRERKISGAENTLLADSGDTLYGSFAGFFSHGDLPVKILNHLQFDVWVPGNHDFEYRPYSFGAFAGTVLGGDWECAGFRPRTWKMFVRAGHRIAVIGLGVRDLKHRLLPDSGVRFREPDEVLDHAVSEALAAKAELLVLIWHNGLHWSGGSLYECMRRHPEIHVVIGAHTHQEIPGRKAGQSWYVQPGSHGRALAVIRVRFPDRGKPLIRSGLIRPDVREKYCWPPEIAGMLEVSHRAGMRRLGTAPGPLRQPDNRDFRGVFGDLAEKVLKRTTGAAVTVLAMYQGTESCGNAPDAAGFFRVYPYAGRICMVELVPEDLEQVIRDLVRFQHKRPKLSVRFGGIRLYRDRKGNVTKMEMPPPGPDGRIRVGMTDFELLGAGDRQAFLPRKIAAGLAVADTGILLRDAVAEELTLPER